MSKKIIALSIVIILAAVILFMYINSRDTQLIISTEKTHSIEVTILDENGRRTNKSINSRKDSLKVLEYLNSLTLARTSFRPQDAVNTIQFKGANGEAFKSLRFGKSGVIWIGSKTYTMKNSDIGTLISLLKGSDS